MALTEREKKILQLRADGLSDYKIGRRLKVDPANVTHSRENAARKIERAIADLKFLDDLEADVGE